MTAPGGAVSTYTYSGSNENIKIATSLGPSTYMTYDEYGNLLTTARMIPMPERNLGIGYKKGSNAEMHKNAFDDVIAVYRNSDSVLIRMTSGEIRSV